MKYTDSYLSPLGEMLLESNGKQLCALRFIDQKQQPGVETKVNPSLSVFSQTKFWLDTYFQGSQPTSLPPLSLAGTAFQKEVWEILLTIPYGSSVRYGEIATILADRRKMKKMSARAVGQAVGRNPVSIIVPCHRVVGSDGTLTGYAGGIERKKALLRLEKIFFQ